MLLDEFNTSVGNLTKSVNNLAARIAAQPPASGTGGSVPDAVVAANVSAIDDATKKLDSLLPAGAPIAGTSFTNPLK